VLEKHINVFPTEGTQMQSGKFNVVTDGAWGSCGKGLITTALADHHRPQILSTTNMANAGHTAVWPDGPNNCPQAFVAKVLPSAAILRKWLSDRRKPYDPHIVVGSTAAFTIDQLMDEIQATGSNYQLTIHERAGVITDEHKALEADSKEGTKHLASTMQGCGALLAEKVMRKKELKLAKDYSELAGYMPCHMPNKISDPEMRPSIIGKSLPMILLTLMNKFGVTILHEGAQGFSLDINHGSHYPQCTSRGTTAVSNLADMGLPPTAMGDVYVVIRPYPIRVGNVIEEGKTIGYSGDCYDDHEETNWETVAKGCGAPPEVMKGELTTVTKRLRRVFTFSEKQLVEAVTINGATRIALNFANYIDWECYGTSVYSELPAKVMDFIHKVEDIAGIPVTMVGTGPRNDHVCLHE
jgi:adenylosuccinate synthase